MKYFIYIIAVLFGFSSFAKLDADDQKALAKDKAKAKSEATIIDGPKGQEKVVPAPTSTTPQGPKYRSRAAYLKDKAKEKAALAEANKKKSLAEAAKLVGDKVGDKIKDKAKGKPMEDPALETALDEEEAAIEAIGNDLPAVVKRLGVNYGTPGKSPQHTISYNTFRSVPENPGALEANRTVIKLDPTKFNDCSDKGLPLSTDDLQAQIDALKGKPCVIEDTNILKCLVCNLHHEAGNQSDAGQIAVGQVTLTRTFTSSYKTPTVCGAVWAKSQFSWTMDSVVLPENRYLPENETQIKRLIENSRKALCRGPGDFTNYYAWQIVTPDWRYDKLCSDSLRNLDAHNFCADRETINDRKVEDVMRAEGLINPDGTLNSTGAPPADAGR